MTIDDAVVARDYERTRARAQRLGLSLGVMETESAFFIGGGYSFPSLESVNDWLSGFAVGMHAGGCRDRERAELSDRLAAASVSDTEPPAPPGPKAAR